MNHDLKNGYTSLANTLWESMAKKKLPGNCWRVLFWVIRNGWGYKRDWTNRQTKREIAREINMDNSSVDLAIKVLLEKGIIREVDGKYKFLKRSMPIHNLPSPLGTNKNNPPREIGNVPSPLGRLPSPLGTDNYNKETLKENIKSIEESAKAEKQVNWDNCKTDIQRLIAYHISVDTPEVYASAKSPAIQAIFKRHCRDAKDILDVAGSLDIAKQAYIIGKRYFESRSPKPLPWNLTTIAKNATEFVNSALIEKRGNNGK